LIAFGLVVGAASHGAVVQVCLSTFGFGVDMIGFEPREGALATVNTLTPRLNQKSVSLCLVEEPNIFAKVDDPRVCGHDRAPISHVFN
jgi:hypothetical protein